MNILSCTNEQIQWNKKKPLKIVEFLNCYINTIKLLTV